MVKAKSLKHKKARLFHFRPLQLRNREEYEGKISVWKCNLF